MRSHSDILDHVYYLFLVSLNFREDSKKSDEITGLAVLVPEVGSTWCLCESGACGPTFTFPEITTGLVFFTHRLNHLQVLEICKAVLKEYLLELCRAGCCCLCSGFTAIFVSGPIERGVFVESGHNDREANMLGPLMTGHCDSDCDRTSPKRIKRREVLTAGKARREWCKFQREQNAVVNKNPQFIAGIAGAISFRARWSYTKAALQLLADCVKDAQAQQTQQAQARPRVGRILHNKCCRERICGAMLNTAGNA